MQTPILSKKIQNRKSESLFSVTRLLLLLVWALTSFSNFHISESNQQASIYQPWALKGQFNSKNENHVIIFLMSFQTCMSVTYFETCVNMTIQWKSMGSKFCFFSFFTQSQSLLCFHPPTFICILGYHIKKLLDRNGKMHIHSKNLHQKLSLSRIHFLSNKNTRFQNHKGEYMKENLIFHSLYLNVFTILRHYLFNQYTTLHQDQCLCTTGFGDFFVHQKTLTMSYFHHISDVFPHILQELSAFQRHIILGWSYRGMLSRSIFPSIQKLCLSGTV